MQSVMITAEDVLTVLMCFKHVHTAEKIPFTNANGILLYSDITNCLWL